MAKTASAAWATVPVARPWGAYVANLSRAIVLLLSALFAFVVVAGYYRTRGILGLDWSGFFYPAALRVAHGQQLYITSGEQLHTVAIFNPPPFLLAVVALARLGPTASNVAWGLLSLAMVLAAVPLAAAALGRPISARHVAVLCWWTAAYVPTLLLCVVYAQVTAPVVLGYGLSLWLFTRRREGWAGAALALTLVKPQLAFLTFPFLLYTRRWRAAAGYLAVAGSATIVALIVFGPRTFVEYVQAQRAISGWTLTLDGLQPDVPGIHGMFLQIWPHSLLAHRAAELISAVLVGFLALYWRGSWRPESPRFALGWAMLVITTLLIAPFAHTYDVALLVLPCLVLHLCGSGTRLHGWAAYAIPAALLALYLSPDLRMLARHHFMVPAMLLALAALWLLARSIEPRTVAGGYVDGAV
jgi:hypothetical protein